MKTCLSCGEEKDLAEFWVKRFNKDGRFHDCKDCARENTRYNVKNNALRANYGITLAQYDEMFEAQGGLCKACGQPESQKSKFGVVKRLAVDHDHHCCPGKKTCGECIRGLLCMDCNTILGKVNDDPHRLRALIEYVEKR